MASKAIVKEWKQTKKSPRAEPGGIPAPVEESGCFQFSSLFFPSICKCEMKGGPT